MNPNRGSGVVAVVVHLQSSEKRVPSPVDRCSSSDIDHLASTSNMPSTAVPPLAFLLLACAWCLCSFPRAVALFRPSHVHGARHVVDRINRPTTGTSWGSDHGISRSSSVRSVTMSSSSNGHSHERRRRGTSTVTMAARSGGGGATKIDRKTSQQTSTKPSYRDEIEKDWRLILHDDTVHTIQQVSLSIPVPRPVLPRHALVKTPCKVVTTNIFLHPCSHWRT